MRVARRTAIRSALGRWERRVFPIRGCVELVTYFRDGRPVATIVQRARRKPIMDEQRPRCRASLTDPEWWTKPTTVDRCPNVATHYDYDLHEDVCEGHIVQPGFTATMRDAGFEGSLPLVWGPDPEPEGDGHGSTHGITGLWDGMVDDHLVAWVYRMGGVLHSIAWNRHGDTYAYDKGFFTEGAAKAWAASKVDELDCAGELTGSMA